MGSRHRTWTKEEDDKIVSEICNGTKVEDIAINMKTSSTSIYRQIEKLGFSGVRDVKAVMIE
jgi:DNA-binding MurR/RpiR family transcriptional regulator